MSTGRPFVSFRTAVCALVALAALALVPAVARATVVSGTVIDLLTRQPVAGVHVFMDGAQAETSTDAGGHFSLSVPIESGRLEFTHVGYARRELSFGGVSALLTVELAPTVLPRQAREVTGRAITRPQIDDARSTGALTRQDLQRDDGLSLESSINTLPGVRMQSRSAWGSSRIQIRGYDPGQSPNSDGYGVEVSLDDVPVTDATGLTILDDIDFSALGRIEVINGPASSGFGTAIGGTVNATTDMPAPGTNAVSQHVVGGGDQLFRTTTTYEHATDVAATVFGYGHQTYDSFRPNAGSQKDFAHYRGEYRAWPRHVISTMFDYGHSLDQLAGELALEDLAAGRAIGDPAYERNHARVDIQSARTGITDAVRFDDHFDARTTLYLAALTRSQVSSRGFDDDHRFTFGARSALGVKAQVGEAGLDGSIGLSFQRTDVVTNGNFFISTAPAIGFASDQQHDAMNTFAFTEWTVSLPEDVIATVGGTLGVTEFGYRDMFEGVFLGQQPAHRKAFDPKFLPRAGLLKRFAEQFSVYANASTGSTPPPLVSIVNGDGTIAGGLKPETATQYELGSKGRLFGKRLSYSLALYDLDIQDKLVPQTSSGVARTVNAGEQRNRGIELSASALVVNDERAAITTVRPWLSWTCSDGAYVHYKSDANDDASTVDFSGRVAAQSPRSVVNLGLDAQAKCGGYLFATYRHVDAQYLTFDHSVQVSAYELVSARLGWKHAVSSRLALDASAGGDNLTGSNYPRFFFVGPSDNAIVRPYGSGVADPGPYDATFYATLRVTWAL